MGAQESSFLVSCSDDCIRLSLGNTSVFKKYDTSASGQDGITGARLNLSEIANIFFRK